MRAWSCLEIQSMDYDEARALQLGLVQARKANPQLPDVVILLEHPAVFTVGRRGDLAGLRVGQEFLRSKGVGLRRVERGGLITFHGPGQLVCYPVVHLGANGWKVVEFVGALEEVMIRTAGAWGIRACRSPLNRGVWAEGKKLGSVGIAVRAGISFHGFALNVNTDLEPFSWIDPCGLPGVRPTSIAQLLGAEVGMAKARSLVKDALEEVFGVRLQDISLDELQWLTGASPGHEEPLPERGR